MFPVEGTENGLTSGDATDLDDVDQATGSLKMQPVVVAICDGSWTGEEDKLRNPIRFSREQHPQGQSPSRAEDTTQSENTPAKRSSGNRAPAITEQPQTDGTRT